MDLIPYAVTYKTTLSGRTPKLVSCAKCGFEYVYLLKVTVDGEGTACFSWIMRDSPALGCGG